MFFQTATQLLNNSQAQNNESLEEILKPIINTLTSNSTLEYQYFTLSFLYNDIAICKNIVDVPIEDCFSRKINLNLHSETSELIDEKDKKKIINLFNQKIKSILIKAISYARVFGRSVIIIKTEGNDDYTKELTDEEIKNNKIQLFPFDPFLGITSTNDVSNIYKDASQKDGNFMIKGVKIHPTRLILFDGENNDMMMQIQLQGFSNSIFTKIRYNILTYLNSLIALNDCIQKAKLTVFKKGGLEKTMFSDDYAQNWYKQLESIKQTDTNSVLMIDENSELIQLPNPILDSVREIHKQATEMLGMASKIPVNKLLGESSTGFAGGQDAMQNYYNFVKGNVEKKYENQMQRIFKILCLRLFPRLKVNVKPEDIEILFDDFVQLSAKEKQEAKTNEINNIINAFNAGLIDDITVAKDKIKSLIGES